MAVEKGFPPCGRRGGLLIQDGGRGHLPAGHPVDGIVDEDDGDVFPSVGRMKTLRDADGGEISVPLVGKDDAIREDPLDPRGHGRPPSMLRLDHVDIEIVVGQHGTSRRRDADRDAPDIQFIDHLGDQPVGDAVTASRTVVKDRVLHAFRSAKHFFHFPVLAAFSSRPFVGNGAQAATNSVR